MNMNPGGESWKERIREQRQRDALPSVPPATLEERLDMLAEQLGIAPFHRRTVDLRHPSLHQPSEIEDLYRDYDPVAEAERVLYETGEN